MFPFNFPSFATVSCMKNPMFPLVRVRSRLIPCHPSLFGTCEIKEFIGASIMVRRSVSPPSYLTRWSQSLNRNRILPIKIAIRPMIVFPKAEPNPIIRKIMPSREIHLIPPLCSAEKKK